VAQRHRSPALPARTGEAMTLLPWPEAPYIDDRDDDWLEYERARAEAALQRLRVAVAQLRCIQTLAILHTEVASGRTWPGSVNDLSMWKSEIAKEALEHIGEIPE
jgi:hypothetical protein